MAKINTLNYQTVASWNGSQDLFVVEQPDGTKVATPALLKQFMEAGDFEATGEVKDGHGNILKDMAKSADVDAEIGDLSQTGLTGDSVAEQLDAARLQIANKVKRIISQNYYTCSSTSYEYTGVSVACPTGHMYMVRARTVYFNSQPSGTAASVSSTSYGLYQCYDRNDNAAFITFILAPGETAYIWGRWSEANTKNRVDIEIMDITL